MGGAITLSFGFANAAAAILAATLVLFVTGIPISVYAARHGVDIDLLTRGAGFGYIGSTITSLIYATFTFILFAVEASIMTAALELAFGLPLWIGYIVSAVVVDPARHPRRHLDQPLPALDPAALDRAQPPAGRLHPGAGLGLGGGLDRLSRPRRHGADGFDLLKFARRPR